MFDHSPCPDEDPAGGAGLVPDSINTASSTPLGRRAFIAGTAGAAVATALSSGAHAAVPAGASYYEPVGPLRVADTRDPRIAPEAAAYKDFQYVNATAKHIRIDMLGRADVPDDAVSVVVTVTGIYNGTNGFIQAVPAGSNNFVSNINMSAGDGAVANLATVTIRRDVSTGSSLFGKIDVKSRYGYDMVVDLVGVYRATSTGVAGGRLKFLDKTKRVVSDRACTDGTTIPVNLNGIVPSTATAVVVNLTAATTEQAGYFTAYPSGPADRPTVSNLNWVPGDTRAVGAIVKLGRNGTRPAISVFCRGKARLFIDVTGYITGPGDTSGSLEEGLFVPISPNRVMDTRRVSDRQKSGKARLWPNWRRTFTLPQNTDGFGSRTQMAGVAMNTTIVTAMTLGFATVLPAQTALQLVSNINVSRPGHIVANHVISRASTKGIETYLRCGGDLIADVAGWYTGSPQAITQSAPTPDPPAPPPLFNWTMTVPSLTKRYGSVLQTQIEPNVNSGTPVVDRGDSWHWTNTGLLNQSGARVVVFGHRTSHGGPYYNQHLLQPGAEMIVDTRDGRRYTYRFVRDELTNSSATNILAAARRQPGTTISMVACTGTGSTGALNRSPGGSTRWRIVSTFVLVDTPSGGFIDTTPAEPG